MPKPVCGPYGDLPREGSPIASRDGRMLAWIRWSWASPERTTVFVSGADGSAGQRVVVPGRSSEDHPTALAPDASEVLIERGWISPRFILASTLGSRARFVTAADAHEIRRRWRAPDWSPDGRFRVESSTVDGIWIVPADGGARRRISEIGAYTATWSPAGDWIAFASNEATGNDSDLYLIRPDGTELRRLTRDGFGASSPSWAPDGSLLAFDRDFSHYHEGSAIGVIRPDGSRLRLLRRPHEGPDERSAVGVGWVDTKTLVFESYQRREGPLKVVGIHTIGVNGRNERRVTYHCHVGTRRDNTLRGSNLGDTLRALAGNDDVDPGPGADDIDAGTGDDLVRSRDWARDVVRCGPGRDKVIGDRRDIVRGCERVVRR
jgi:hypothetical protein